MKLWEDKPVAGEEVDFSAAVVSQSAETRTIYGERTSKGPQPISFVAGDCIRILARVPSANTGSGQQVWQTSDYEVEKATSTKASLQTAAGVQGLRWQNDGMHEFYALYPSPASSDVKGIKTSCSLSGMWELPFPSEQGRSSVKTSGNLTEWEPDMRNAYMWAACVTNTKTPTLSFQPLFTAFRFVIAAEEDDRLDHFYLVSEKLPLSGTTTVSLNICQSPIKASVSLSRPSVTSATRQIHVDMGGVAISPERKLAFTVFARPESYNDLSVRLVTKNGERILKLADAYGEGIPFEAGKKYDIEIGLVPGKYLSKSEAQQTASNAVSAWKGKVSEEIVSSKFLGRQQRTWTWSYNGSTRYTRRDVGTLNFEVNGLSYSTQFYPEVNESRYAFGNRPLYIVLHGGGNTSQASNDESWRHMVEHYVWSSGTDGGVYIAVQHIDNTWNMHFGNLTTWLYEALIRRCIVQYGVDPNKVYVLGYSAGGDGVWCLAPRLADRWAAASPCAGHPNNIPLGSVYNVPLGWVCGEKDTGVNRNTANPEYISKLDQLQAAYPEGYNHDGYMVPDGGHATPYTQSAAGTRVPPYLNKFTRNPYPKRVIFQRTDGDQRNPQTQYWLGIPDEIYNSADATVKATFARGNKAEAHIEGQTVIVDQCDWDKLTIFLRDELLDMDKEVVVKYGGKVIFQGKVPRRASVIERTLAQRNDPCYAFYGAVTVPIRKPQ